VSLLALLGGFKVSELFLSSIDALLLGVHGGD
jgi:hypothetical protein